ncbi:MAG: hypothetical protein J7578_05225 [Chitinophagaceae bacterium]|nr:hypothetical protein [Chitinophagaceae bacterium]
MKSNKKLIWTLVILVIVAAVYRVIPGRPMGFAPQIAIALFSGAMIKDKKLAFLFPVLSMLISDLFYQGLFAAGMAPYGGFYGGMWINYILFTSVTVFGMMIRKNNVTNVLVASLAGPTYFFLVSNFLTWAGVGDFVEYPKTWEGLMACYAAGIPFYKGSLMATVAFSGLFFGGWALIGKKQTNTVVA